MLFSTINHIFSLLSYSYIRILYIFVYIFVYTSIHYLKIRVCLFPLVHQCKFDREHILFHTKPWATYQGVYSGEIVFSYLSSYFLDFFTTALSVNLRCISPSSISSSVANPDLTILKALTNSFSLLASSLILLS